MNNRANNNGFTLIELILVISLMSLLLVFSIPLFNTGTRSSNHRSKVQALVFLIESLKQKAVQTDEDLFLHIDPDAGLAWVTTETMEEPSREKAMENGFRLDDQITILNVEFNPAKHPDGTEAVICFRHRGYSDNALIHLRENTHDITLYIAAFLPEVERHDRYVSFDDCI